MFNCVLHSCIPSRNRKQTKQNTCKLYPAVYNTIQYWCSCIEICTDQRTHEKQHSSVWVEISETQNALADLWSNKFQSVWKQTQVSIWVATCRLWTDSEKHFRIPLTNRNWMQYSIRFSMLKNKVSLWITVVESAAYQLLAIEFPSRVYQKCVLNSK